MAYSQFKTIRSVKQAFDLTVVEGNRFLPDLAPVEPSAFLLTRSPDILEIEVPVVVLIEAKKTELKSGLGNVLQKWSRRSGLTTRQISLVHPLLPLFTVVLVMGLNGNFCS